MNRYYDINGKLNIEITSTSDVKLFSRVVDLITNYLGAKIIRKLDGPDQKYWDFSLNEAKFCLHFEHYLGITLYAINKQANTLLEKFYEQLQKL